MSAVLAARHLTKHFPGVKALDGVSFELERGEIHALCGENGAGKSTLIKLLGGIHPKGSHEGQLLVDGAPAAFDGPASAEAAGIAVIHQELALVPELSVAENLFLGRLPRRGFRVDWNRLHRETVFWLERAGVSLCPETPVESLGVGQKQLLEIARALSKKSRILILDEPTAALAEHETRTLLDLLRQLRSEGVSSIYISHRLEEVFAIADRITVLRDGRSVYVSRTADTDRQTLIRHMAGRETPESAAVSSAETRAARGAPRTAPRLEITGLRVADPTAPENAPAVLEGIEFSVGAGEILGIGGLMGAGRSSLLMHLAGAWGTRTGGKVRLDGEELSGSSPAGTLKRGLALVSEDRRRYGFIPGESIGFNLSLSSMREIQRGWIRTSLETTRNRAVFDELGIRAPGLETGVSVLSGGNQQKTVLGRVLLAGPKVVLLDEPTRGIDVAAKEEIYVLVRKLARTGVGIVLVSSELPELIRLSDRILMLREGRPSGFFPAGTPAETLLAAAMSPPTP
jgi:D-xylose transport system ATP-binding protein